MLFECATITSISTSHLRVKSIRGSACDRCARGEGCGGGVIGKLIYRRQPALDLKVANTNQFKVGQTVELSIEAGKLLRLAALVYLIPLVAILVGAIAGHVLFASDAGALIGAALGLLISVWLLRQRLSLVLEGWLQPTVRSKEGAY